MYITCVTVWISCTLSITIMSGQDELAEINGVKPKVAMKDGDEREVKSLTRWVVSRPN